MLFDRFNSEAAFRIGFVLPLLNRLGFHSVAHVHGQREFGKDFVFGEITPFGFVRYSAVQVKHIESLSQTNHAGLNELLSQIRQAFAVPFRLLDSPRDRRVSSVYVFNSGHITEGATQYILDTLGAERFAENVHVLDSSRLESVDLYAEYSTNREFRPRLLGLRAQLQLNLAIWLSILESLPSFSEVRGTLLPAVEEFVTAPVGTKWISVNDVAQIWQRARIVDAICGRYILGVRAPAEVRSSDVEAVRRLIAEMMALAARVIAGVDAALSALRPFAELEDPGPTVA